MWALSTPPPCLPGDARLSAEGTTALTGASNRAAWGAVNHNPHFLSPKGKITAQAEASKLAIHFTDSTSVAI